MRIVFTTWAWPSHLYAMVPLAWACRIAGHEIVVASQPSLTEEILRTGLPAAPVGCEVDAVGTFRNIVFQPPGQPTGSGPRVLDLLGAFAGSMAPDLIELVRSWRADLVVYEPTALAGPLAAAVAGVPAVRQLFGTDLMSLISTFLCRVLDPLAQRFGVRNVDPFGLATVDPYPTGLQVPIGSRRLPLRAIPYNGPGLLPPALPAASGRPRICVTWGTTLSRLDPGLFLAGEMVRAVAHLDVELIVTMAPWQRTMLGPVPRGVQVVESAPLHLVLPTCDAVIAHGGAGSLLTALSFGRPQLLVPRLPDHVRHAAQLAEAGAGIVIPAQAAQPTAITAGLTELLGNPNYRVAATHLQRQLADQPPLGLVVRQLQDIAVAARL
jgi:UDP:flavonoid glycosyltransferase YjiC (YdhE family)